MAFPDTPKTLIQRLSATSTEADWQQFLNDYWGPVCRFAISRASLSAADAEDVASLTFEVLLTNRLLARWVLNRSAKLRTLVCSVVRNILSNRARVQSGRERILRELSEQSEPGRSFQSIDASDEQVDAFYAAWVADLLEQAAQSLMDEYHSAGKGDYFRVLYGRICEEMTMPEIAESLGLPLTTVENYFKAARKRLAGGLQELVRECVSRYCSKEDLEEEWQSEWNRLGEHLKTHGGLEDVLRRASSGHDVIAARQRKANGVASTILRIKRDKTA
jgi:RNA polymerase sigma factor (sigma-70 family)